MKYIKKFLTKETRNYKELEEYASIFEMLNNEKSIEEFSSKIKKTLSFLKGDVYLVKRVLEDVEVIGEETKEVKNAIKKSLVYKKLKETKKPYFYNEKKDADDEIYVGFPINSRGRFVGCILIKEKQEITKWKELYFALYLVAFAFRYYELVEKERDINIKDFVTNLYNEKYFYYHLEIEEEKYIRSKQPFTLVLFEIKNLGNINEECGYDVGERALRKFGEWLTIQSRIIDMPARIERGLFGVLLGNTEIDGANALIKRIEVTAKNNILKINDCEVQLEVKSAAVEYDKFYSKESFFKEAQGKLSEN